MGQSTEDYLDRLLRQAMGEPEPEPEPEPEFETVQEMENGEAEVTQPVLEQMPTIEYKESMSESDDEDVNGANFTSNKASQFFADDTPFSEDFVYPEEALEPEASSEIPLEMQMTMEGQKMLDESFGINESINQDTSAFDKTPDDVNIDTGNEDMQALLNSLKGDEPEPLVEPEPFVEPAPIVEAEAVAEPEPIVEPEAEEPEPAVEEAAVEAPKTLSIDDLDPADANKAMDPDDIAALFASMNADTAPAEELEPAVEEAALEAPKTLSIDDLDPADANKAMDPDDIAALFASMNADTAPAEEPVKEEKSVDNTSASADSLFEDQEISDLLNSLDNIDEGNRSSGMEVGGYDVGDVDLGAMLDGVNSSFGDLGSGNTDINTDDFNASDLNALLNSIDGDDDISDIGDMLMKDENLERVAPNSDDVERLFASNNQEELFDINSVLGSDEIIDENGNKKEKIGLIQRIKNFFSRKKSGAAGDSAEKIPIHDSMDGEELMIDPELLDIPNKSEKKEDENKGFLKRLFDKLFEEIDEDTASGSVLGQTAVDIANEGAEVNEKLLKEGADKKKAKKEKKKKEKPKKEKPKKEKKAPKPKKEKKPKEEEPPTKKLPKKKVAAIFIFCFSIGALIAFVCFFVPYSKDMKEAKESYSAGELNRTYELLRGHELNEEDQVLFNQTFTVLKLQRHYESYLNFMRLKRKFDALNALVQGVQAMDKFSNQASELGVSDKFNRFADIITSELQNTFGVTVDQAREWIRLEGTKEYTEALYNYLYNMQLGGELQDAYTDDNSEVISAEEGNL